MSPRSSAPGLAGPDEVRQPCRLAPGAHPLVELAHATGGLPDAHLDPDLDPDVVAARPAEEPGTLGRALDAWMANRPDTRLVMVIDQFEEALTLCADEAGRDFTTRLWDVSEPTRPRPLVTGTGHTNTVFAVAFSPDGRTLASVSADHAARPTDVTGPILAGHDGALSAVAFGPNGRTALVGGEDFTARPCRRVRCPG
ncbi:WD40 repeat domain-containing protein [Embleya sp. NPDC020630]|uniref:WD40 repeat domain-containing protein n=1 Tax=Embleya sp. NPDC020630 TaxID=3363979 RepID=UPI0037B2887D